MMARAEVYNESLVSRLESVIDALREELATVTAERDAARKVASDAQWSLRTVTAERDALRAKVNAVPVGEIYQLIALATFDNRCIADAKAASAWLGTLA
jgi:hypothetical protein